MSIKIRVRRFTVDGGAKVRMYEYFEKWDAAIC